VERLELSGDAWVDVVRGLVRDANDVHDELVATVPWEQGRVFRYERWMDEPRLTAMQHGDGRHTALVEVQDWISRRYHVSFPAVALAHYRDGRDSVAFHRDRELRYLEDTVIGALTLGAQRPWLMRPLTGHRADDDDMTGVLDLSPASGDLVVMGGRCQAAWLHAVPKVRGACASRVSAQWRWTSRRGRRDPNPGYYAPRHFSR
jgi:alkylated DNA repair dioxygenase AlkB